MARRDDQLQGVGPGDRGGDRDHVGPRRHDLRDIDVAQLDDAFDHFPGVLFEQSFAVPLGHDGANFLLERFLVGRGRRAAGEPMQQAINKPGSGRQGQQQPRTAPATPAR